MARWKDKSELPPMPPKEEWGGIEKFSKITKTRKARCQGWSKTKLRNGFRNEEAQCPKPVYGGTWYCRGHLSRGSTIKPKEPKTVMEEFQRYKGHAPDDLMQRMLKMANDPDRFSMIAEIDAITARISQVFERLDTRQSEEGWRQVVEAEKLIRNSIKIQDPKGITYGLSILKQGISKSDYLVWHDLMRIITMRKSLVESERRHMIEQGEMVSVLEVLATMAEIQLAIYDVVSDNTLRVKISDRLNQITSPNPNALPEPGSSGPFTEKKVKGPWWASHPNQRRDMDGCSLCQNEEFRSRNLDSDGGYTCIECGTYWPPPDKVVEGVVDKEDPAPRKKAERKLRRSVRKRRKPKNE